MSVENRIKDWLGLLLQAGILLSLVLVLAGGIAFLFLHGSENFHDNLIYSTNYEIILPGFFYSHFFLTPMGLIELGLLILVLAQILRVVVLCGYYTILRDYWFMLFSFFILSVILYSLLWH